MLNVVPVYLESDMALQRVIGYPLDRRELPTAELDPGRSPAARRSGVTGGGDGTTWIRRR